MQVNSRNSSSNSFFVRNVDSVLCFFLISCWLAFPVLSLVTENPRSGSLFLIGAQLGTENIEITSDTQGRLEPDTGSTYREVPRRQQRSRCRNPSRASSTPAIQECREYVLYRSFQCPKSLWCRRCRAPGSKRAFRR